MNSKYIHFSILIGSLIFATAALSEDKTDTKELLGTKECSVVIPKNGPEPTALRPEMVDQKSGVIFVEVKKTIGQNIQSFGPLQKYYVFVALKKVGHDKIEYSLGTYDTFNGAKSADAASTTVGINDDANVSKERAVGVFQGKSTLSCH